VRVLRSWAALFGGLVVLGAILLVCLLASVRFGAAGIRTGEVVSALVGRDAGSRAEIIVRTLRVPRALAGALVGSSLAVAGAIMQGITRNPLADPGILGIEAGAGLAVVGGVFVFGISSLYGYALLAFAGGGLAAAVVYGLGSLGRGGMTPVRLTLAGASIAALFGSLTTAILVVDRRTLDEIRFWLAGSIAGRDTGLLLWALPYVCTGLVVAFGLSRQITALSLGEEVAAGLGQRTGRVRLLAALAAVLLAGSAVSVAGPVGFIGLVVPHVVRAFVGVDYRWVLPYSALAGAALLILADIAARLVLRPLELPVGVMTALVGAPFFVYLARRRVKG